jgi:hypothetical protein
MANALTLANQTRPNPALNAEPRVQPDPPVRAFYLASAGGGGPVNLVSLGVMQPLARETGK